MTRIQLTLDRELLRRGRRKADQLKISFAEYIRRLIDRDLALGPNVPDVSLVFDLGRSNGSDIARNKDVMLGDAFSDRVR
jgi:hypothetical protein